MASSKDFKALVKDAARQGWTVAQTGNHKLKWTAPNGKVIFSSANPGDMRAIKNHLALMRATGAYIG